MSFVHVLTFLVLACPLSALRQTDEVAVKSIPHRDQEFYSHVVSPSDTENADFYDIDFDASKFIPSSAPYGLPDPQNRWECPYNKMSMIAPTSAGIFAAEKDLLLRRVVELPAGVTQLELRITAHVAVSVYFNGEAVSGDDTSPVVTPGGLCAALDNVLITVPDRFVRTGANLLAIRVTGAETLNYFDMQMMTYYPRPTGDIGSVYAWGKGYFGILGNGYETDSFTPTPILDLKELNTEPIKQLALGVAHTAMLTGSGQVYSWGRGKEGQLGFGEDFTEVPTAVTALNALATVKAVAAGSLHTLALDQDGRVFCYGDNKHNQCGLGDDNTEAQIDEPQRITELEDEPIEHISAKDTFSAAITETGKVFVWGRGIDKSPRYVDTVSQTVSMLSVGSSHLLILDDAGEVFVAGEGDEGQLGLPGNPSKVDGLHKVEALSGIPIARIVAGSDNSFAITAEGKVFVWGGGSFGKNGLGVWQPQRTPIEIQALSSHVIRRIGAGMTSTVFLTQHGEVYHSGSYLRDGTHTLTPTYWASASDKYFAEVYSSHLHATAVTGPSVWEWNKVGDYYQGTMKPDSEI